MSDLILSSDTPSVTTVTFSDNVYQKTVAQFIEDFKKAVVKCQAEKQPWLPVYINSYGGVVYQGLAAVDVMMASPVPVITIAQGTAMSMGVPLFSCGTKRYVTPSSTIMVHGVATWAYGKLDDVEVSLKEAKRLEELSNEIVERNCGLKKGSIRKLTRKKKCVDKYFTAQQALDFGLATHIGSPVFSVKEKKKLKFKMK